MVYERTPQVDNWKHLHLGANGSGLIYTLSMALRHTVGFWPVAAALAGNTAITAAKFVAAFTSGSSVIFSEAVHSAADTVNQILLLIGLRRSLKKADDTFEYGYGNERFFWALLSACGIFFIGAGITAYRGFESLIHPVVLEFNWIIVGVLLFSFVIELYTFMIAARALASAFPRASWRMRLKSADPTTLAVFLEDAIAVLGLVVATVSIALSYYTGNTFWDAIGSLAIAGLLGGTAIALILKNREYLIGRSMPEALQEEVVEMLEADPAIERVIDFKSIVLGWDVYRIKCEIEFNGGSLIREAYGGTTMRKQYNEVKDDFEEFKRFNAEYADRIPRLMGRKIDEIEKRIKEAHPAIRHIDIEIN